MSTKHKGIQSFVANKLLQTNIVSNQTEANKMSTIILVVCCVCLATLAFLVAIGSSTAEIAPEKYYDPTRTD
jgi:hypothetical protein